MAETVAIMQPYFFPYAGYFRLLAASDLFVVYDCVQFPRRGWVHRNRLPDAQGVPQWLTLPLAKAARDVLIRDLRFRPEAAAEFAAQFPRFPLLAYGAADPHGMRAALADLSGTPLDYIERLLARATSALSLRWNTLRSSSLDISPDLPGQERILAIARALANNPSILLADEPTGNLDSVNSARIMEILTGIQKKRGMTLIIVTHENDIANAAPRHIRIRDGRVEA